MKRAFSIVLTLCLSVATLVLLTVAASAATEGIYTYEVANGKATITDCDSAVSGAITIPAKLGGCPVTAIGKEAFFDCGNLISVIIPNGVTSIDDQAFFGCSLLQAVTIPDSVTHIGSMAFVWCHSLSNMNLPDSITSIGARAFEDSAIFENEKNWRNNALYLGNYLLQVRDISGAYKILDGTKVIADYAFWNSEGITSVTVPDSVAVIGEAAFGGCEKNNNFFVAETSPAFSAIDGVLFNKNKTTIICFPQGKVVYSYIIPDSVSTIGDYAFYNCTDLNSITIPDSVTAIGDFAFRNVIYLDNVTIPDSVTTIGESAFDSCLFMFNLTIGSKVATIGANAFTNTDLTNVIIPASVTDIGDCAFSNNDLIEFVVDESNQNYTSVGGVLFNKDKTELICFPSKKKGDPYCIPDGVTSIQASAFSYCSELIGVAIPNSVTVIGERAFYLCEGLTSVVIPDGITAIAPDTFSYCSSLASITIPDSVTTIGKFAFERCEKLTSVTIPGSVNCLDYGAFYGCTGLTSVTIPESVTSIGDMTYFDCTGLRSVFFCGDAPEDECAVFQTYDNELNCSFIPGGLTLYYIAGKKGWTSPTWHDYPTKVWQTPGLPFADLAAGKWYLDGINFAYDNKLFTGTGAGMFSPNGTMTRAMLVTVLWRLDGETVAKAPSNFSDVLGGKWYSEAVAWAAENGIVTGTGGGKFAPDGSVTREQIAVILHRYAKFKGLDTAKAANLSAFPDGSAVSAWAGEALSWANAEALITGSLTEGKLVLAPQGQATRAQVATILMRFCEAKNA